MNICISGFISVNANIFERFFIMNREEKEMLYFVERRIRNVKSTLEVIKSELSNKNGSLSSKTIKGAIACAIDSLDMAIYEDMAE